jgi:hypothetical protein
MGHLDTISDSSYSAANSLSSSIKDTTNIPPSEVLCRTNRTMGNSPGGIEHTTNSPKAAVNSTIDNTLDGIDRATDTTLRGIELLVDSAYDSRNRANLGPDGGNERRHTI